MSESENFLSRWARRKQEAAREEIAPNEEGAEKNGALVDGSAQAQPKKIEERNDKQPAGETEKKAEEPAFDLSKLPSIESITAETDIRPFLSAGVPASLKQAALRRVWVADPKIRDFIEVAENQWDFTAGGNAPGFDFSAPIGDVKRMVAELLGERQEAEPKSDDRAATGESVTPEVPGEVSDHLHVSEEERTSSKVTSSAALDDSVRLSSDALLEDSHSRDVALQKNDALHDEPMKISRRTHGGAMPK